MIYFHSLGTLPYLYNINFNTLTQGYNYLLTCVLCVCGGREGGSLQGVAGG